MRVWHFTEMPYPDLPPLDTLESTRVNIPSSLFDPQIGADLYNRYLDEYMIGDHLGFDLMVNEHHQMATCLNAAAPLPAAILARQTSRARILILGNPVSHSGNPVRVAEEMAMIDCISRGRLECGFVRGVPSEIFASNTNPTQTTERLWEGIDLIVQSWTSQSGGFSYEGKHWHKRQINIWPRPFQRPHPPIWVTGSTDTENVIKVAQRGFVFAMFLQHHDNVKKMFDLYRSNFVEGDQPGGLAYMPMVYTGDSMSAAEKGAGELTWYLRASKAEPQFKTPPGYVPTAVHAKMLRGESNRLKSLGTLAELEEQGLLIYGTPDVVAKRIKKLHRAVGGFDHLLMMQHAGAMSSKSTVRSMTLFAKEVYPEIQNLERASAKDI